MKKFSTLRDIVNLVPGQKSWFRIENKADVSTVHIYGVIGWDVTAQDFIKELNAVSSPKMNVHIATEGGDVFDGIAILNALRTHPAEVTTIVDSQALSAGSFILQAGTKRKMMPNSTVMVHNAQTVVGGGPREMQDALDLLNKASDNIASIYAERAGGSVEDWRNVMSAETWYSAQEAVDAGLADEVVQVTKPTNKQPVPVVNKTEPEFSYDPELIRKALQEVFK